MIKNTCNDCGTVNMSHEEFCSKCSNDLRENNEGFNKKNFVTDLFSFM